MTHSKTDEIDLDEILSQFEAWIRKPHSTLYRHHDILRTKAAIEALIEQKVLEARIDEVSRIVHELNLTDNPKEVNAFIVKFGIDRLITLEDQAEVQDTSNGGGE